VVFELDARRIAITLIQVCGSPPLRPFLDQLIHLLQGFIQPC
jgi:hypothetical protein